MSVYDDGTDLGKDITDPAGPAGAETRGGETPADWTGPLPEKGKPYRRYGHQASGDADWCGHPECGGDLVSRAAEIRAALLAADELDQAWLNRVPDDDRRYAGWMPFSNDNFLVLAAQALRAADGDPPSFFGIGCGIGTKEMLARDVLGFRVSGIERVTALAVQAAQLGVDVEMGDAAEYGGYGKHDVVWFNRACRDPRLQAELESWVWENMRPGAVAICANLEAPPSGWIIIDQDLDYVCRGAWQKQSA